MEHLSQATRDILWNVPMDWLMYPLFVLSLVSLAGGFYLRIRRWRRGRPDPERLSGYAERLRFALLELLLQRRIRRERLAGLFHSAFFYGFIILTITTTIIALDHHFSLLTFRGWTYVVWTVLADGAGLLFLIGVGMAVWRRTVTRPFYLDSDRGDAIALGLLALILLTGFLLEGLRISLRGDPWALLSPVGYAVSIGFSGIDPGTSQHLHAVVWWIHTGSVMFWIAVIPWTNFRHLLLVPVNIFFRKTKPHGELNRIDLQALMEDPEFDAEGFSIGLDTSADLTWKQRLNLDACVSCGRCDAVCPALAAGLSLSPKQFIQGMKGVLDQDEIAGKDVETTATEMVGNAFDELFFWHCRTCRACDEACPAFVEHVDNQIEIRRNEVNMKGRMPAELEQMLRQMETNGNPMGSQSERVKWTSSLDVPVIGPGESCDVLYWIGCLTTFDPVKRPIALDLMDFMRDASVDFGILGAGERCCGDPARVSGEENLFQTIARQQAAELNDRTFRILLTSCPHCYNVLKNEYPQFGGKYRVMHHTEFIRETGVSPANLEGESAAFHDPCYLGRYQGIYDAPRQVLREIDGLKTRELQQSGPRSFCCGAGGGHFWMDIREGERINHLRMQQFRDAGVDRVVTACPFCQHMLDDAAKLLNLEDRIQVTDIISLLRKNGND